jgi:hypothetical protein
MQLIVSLSNLLLSFFHSPSSSSQLGANDIQAMQQKEAAVLVSSDRFPSEEGKVQQQQQQQGRKKPSLHFRSSIHSFWRRRRRLVRGRQPSLYVRGGSTTLSPCFLLDVFKKNDCRRRRRPPACQSPYFIGQVAPTAHQGC